MRIRVGLRQTGGDFLQPHRQGFDSFARHLREDLTAKKREREEYFTLLRFPGKDRENKLDR
jgi:hypothetical protein